MNNNYIGKVAQGEVACIIGEIFQKQTNKIKTKTESDKNVKNIFSLYNNGSFLLLMNWIELDCIFKVPWDDFVFVKLELNSTLKVHNLLGCWYSFFTIASCDEAAFHS